MNILVVEDDAHIAQHISVGLGRFGHQTILTESGEEALLHLQDHRRFDAIILDRLLPGIDGIEVLRRVRQDHGDPPVLILSALNDTWHRIQSIQAGADDYLAKPFSMVELNARLNAIVRRVSRFNARETIVVGNIVLSLVQHKVTRKGRVLELGAREFDLLRQLLQNYDRTMTRQMLIESVWGYSFEPGVNIVEANISRLRVKLTQFGDPDPIETVRGAGYVLVADLA